MSHQVAETLDAKNFNALNQTAYNSLESNASKSGEARPLVEYADESPKKVKKQKSLKNKMNVF